MDAMRCHGVFFLIDGILRFAFVPSLRVYSVPPLFCRRHGRLSAEKTYVWFYL